MTQATKTDTVETVTMTREELKTELKGLARMYYLHINFKVPSNKSAERTEVERWWDKRESIEERLLRDELVDVHVRIGGVLTNANKIILEQFPAKNAKEIKARYQAEFGKRA